MGEGEGGMIWENGIETCIISYTKRVASPGQCTILDAWGWCTGMTQRDGMGREDGGGFRMGNTCIPWWIHVDVWQNQYNIVKLKNKIKYKKINKNKQTHISYGKSISDGCRESFLESNNFLFLIWFWVKESFHF